MHKYFLIVCLLISFSDEIFDMILLRCAASEINGNIPAIKVYLSYAILLLSEGNSSILIILTPR